MSQTIPQEEVMWRQRSRVQWLAGDKKRNRISKLKKPDSLVTEDDKEMANLTRGF